MRMPAEDRLHVGEGKPDRAAVEPGPDQFAIIQVDFDEAELELLAVLCQYSNP